MESVLRPIFDIVIWFFVPAILVIILWYIKSVAKRTDDLRHKHTTRAGFWAGFVLFLIALIDQVGVYITTGFPDRDIYQGFSIPLALTGAAIGFVLFSGGKKVLPAKLAGWIVLVVSFLGFYGLLQYLFVRTWNEALLSLILGVTFGIFSHMAASPATLRDFLSAT